MDIVGQYFAQHNFLVAALPPRNADPFSDHIFSDHLVHISHLLSRSLIAFLPVTVPVTTPLLWQLSIKITFGLIKKFKVNSVHRT